MMINAEELTWHDASIDAAHYEESARRLTWQVEVFRWDRAQDGDAESGQLIFKGVQQIKRFHDMVNEASPDPPWGWEVLDTILERTEESLRCRFFLHLHGRTNKLGGHGYGELSVTCQNIWYTPAHFPDVNPLPTRPGPL
ncbi:hypothetical protein MF271_21220 (plasmid) [Deinococcus sp. KNUC1210]|uniref:hypothetical protein n=1 Tax=Deinococcus sp. KNUC1210 TaxID=2917691 RepID=UPI001EF151E5|nr:hypothetical protein [Deinococcus sp. KNUC1210]ULH17574.1 hypothetical protein MF271_21220 [Deinococcus sp. KNUC1210]